MLDFDDDIYDDCVFGMGYKKYCNKHYKPSLYDLSHHTEIEPGDIWFVKRDYLLEFFSNIPTGAPDISVVTQHSDYDTDDALYMSRPANIRALFSPNNISTHKNCIPIPLGLGPPYCKITPKPIDFKNIIPILNNKTNLLYVNFRTYSYPKERIPLADRLKYLKQKNPDYITFRSEPPLTPVVIDEYLHELSRHKFSICPRGNGIDTHRLWETIYCKSIPIVRQEWAHRNFLDLPILFVDSWDQISIEFLNDKYLEISERSWNYDKLKASWWGKQFKESLKWDK